MTPLEATFTISPKTDTLRPSGRGASHGVKRPGFTLMELLVYISIVSIALVVFINYMVSVTQVAGRSKVASAIDQNARYAISRMTQDIRGAANAVVAGAVLQLSNDTTEYTTSGLAVTINHGGAPIAITDDTVKVSSLIFTQPAAGAPVTITLTITGRDGTPPSAQKTLTLASTVEPHQLLY